MSDALPPMVGDASNLIQIVGACIGILGAAAAAMNSDPVTLTKLSAAEAWLAKSKQVLGNLHERDRVKISRNDVSRRRRGVESLWDDLHECERDRDLLNENFLDASWVERRNRWGKLSRDLDELIERAEVLYRDVVRTTNLKHAEDDLNASTSAVDLNHAEVV
ncbi:hypothetical protein DENSPDRAFT_838742 [Dentipellis sp. KUC8613]|nr:hypothetical protein DENSPDRAFT_838742 [Dentipellis sp. KUC8613]